MRKDDFVVFPASDDGVIPEGSIGITSDQYRFLNLNPAVNGQRLLHFLLTSDNMDDAVKAKAFKDILDKAVAEKAPATAVQTPAPVVTPVAAPVIPPVIPPVSDVNLTQTVAEGPAITAPEVKNEAVDGIRTMLEAMPDKDAVLDYAEKMGLKIDIHHASGKAKVIDAVINAMVNQKQA